MIYNSIVYTINIYNKLFIKNDKNFINKYIYI